jgi:hypothetical protein
LTTATVDGLGTVKLAQSLPLGALITIRLRGLQGAFFLDHSGTKFGPSDKDSIDGCLSAVSPHRPPTTNFLHSIINPAQHDLRVSLSNALRLTPIGICLL